MSTGHNIKDNTNRRLSIFYLIRINIQNILVLEIDKILNFMECWNKVNKLVKVVMSIIAGYKDGYIDNI